jgi:hypothetical protein
MNKFLEANVGEDLIDAKVKDVVADAHFIVLKHEKLAGMMDKTASLIASEKDNIHLVNAFEAACRYGINGVVEAKTDEELHAAVNLYFAKVDALLKAEIIYNEYVAALEADTRELDKDELALRMNASFEVTTGRIAVADDEEKVVLNLKFVKDELNSIYAK